MHSFVADGDTINEETEDDEDEPQERKSPPTAGNESQTTLEVPTDPPTPPPHVRKRSMDDREEDEDLFENPVSMTVAQLAPLSSISEVTLHNDDQLSLSTAEVHVV